VEDCCSVNAVEREAPDRVGKRSRWARAGATLAAVGVALLPKCPACWSIYAGLGSWLGISVVVEPRYLMPLTFVSLALAVGALGWMALSRRRYVALSLGVVAALGVWLGKFVLWSEALTLVSLLGLVLSAFGARISRAARAGRAGSELPQQAEAR
jgi:hypothetical protein